jgi:uncharacterized membrane protein YqjE
MTERRDDRSLGELLGDLGSQVTTLVRKEIELARTEMTDKASAAGRDAALIGVGTALLYAGFLGLMAAIVLGLIEAGLDPWIAALLVGVVVAAVGGALVAKGRSGLTTTDLTPKRTIETIQDDAEWVKERTP